MHLTFYKSLVTRVNDIPCQEDRVWFVNVVKQTFEVQATAVPIVEVFF